MTVVIIAVATAFLVGTMLLLLTAETHAATVSSDLETATYYDSLENAEAAASDRALVFLVAVVNDETGMGHTVVGIPPDAPDELAGASTSWEPATIPPPGGTARGPVSEERELRLEG